jgi:hypothetical protein
MISEDAMQQMVAKAIFETMTAEQRETLVQGAITHLLTVPLKGPHSYSSTPPKSPLQEAFEMSVYKLAREMAVDMIEKDETVRTHVKTLLGDALAKLFDDDTVRERIADKMSEALSDIFSRVR